MWFYIDRISIPFKDFHENHVKRLIKNRIEYARGSEENNSYFLFFERKNFYKESEIFAEDFVDKWYQSFLQNLENLEKSKRRYSNKLIMYSITLKSRDTQGSFKGIEER